MNKLQAYKDFNNVSKGRLFLNKELLPKWAFRCPDGSDVLFVGCHKYWQYQCFWDNPAKLCNFYTIDTHPGGGDQPTPDYNMSVESCSDLQGDRFQQVVMIGVYEYLDHFDEAVKQIHRILKVGGQAIFAFTGRGEYPDSRGMDKQEVYDRLKPLRILEQYNIYEGKDEPNSVVIVAEKI
jgi:SAM-dependent methyltransferase